jgi:hypothetical protein
MLIFLVIVTHGQEIYVLTILRKSGNLCIIEEHGEKARKKLFSKFMCFYLF